MHCSNHTSSLSFFKWT